MNLPFLKSFAMTLSILTSLFLIMFLLSNSEFVRKKDLETSLPPSYLSNLEPLWKYFLSNIVKSMKHGHRISTAGIEKAY